MRLCQARGCSREDAKELVQEAHLRFFEYQRTTKVRDVESLLRRLVINLSITNYYREMSRPSFKSVDGLDRRGLLVDAAPSPERAVEAERQLDAVASLLNAVSPRTCQIFIAHRGGYSYEEIALAFAIRPRTVEKHLATATSLLRESSIGTAPGSRRLRHET